MAGFKRSITAKERFMSFVDKTNDCWPWSGFIGPNGRGQFRLNGARPTASRAAWIIFNGPIDERRVVCHRCDNPLCVNPDHLFLGSQQDNVDDMISKGRQVVGSKRSQSKLTEQDIRDILSMTSKRYFEHQEIAQMYGVNRSLISMIINGRRWKHVSRGGDLSQTYR